MKIKPLDSLQVKNKRLKNKTEPLCVNGQRYINAVNGTIIYLPDKNIIYPLL